MYFSQAMHTGSPSLTSTPRTSGTLVSLLGSTGRMVSVPAAGTTTAGGCLVSIPSTQPGGANITLQRNKPDQVLMSCCIFIPFQPGGP